MVAMLFTIIMDHVFLNFYHDYQNYHKISNIRHTKSPNLNVSGLVLKLSLPNPMKPDVSREWGCSWSSADRRCSNYIWVIDNFIANWGASYIRGFTVVIIWCHRESGHQQDMYKTDKWILPLSKYFIIIFYIVFKMTGILSKYKWVKSKLFFVWYTVSVYNLCYDMLYQSISWYLIYMSVVW